VDTKGVTSTPIVTTMAGILAEALARNAVPAHITGWVPDLQEALPGRVGDPATAAAAGRSA
jgi:hypothetical protein